MLLLFAILPLAAVVCQQGNTDLWMLARAKLVPPESGETMPRLLAWWRQWPSMHQCVSVTVDEQPQTGSWFPLLQESDVPSFFDPNSASKDIYAASMPALWERLVVPTVADDATGRWRVVKIQLWSSCKPDGSTAPRALLQQLEFVHKPAVASQPKTLRFVTASCNRVTVAWAESNVLAAMVRQHHEEAFDFGVWTGDVIYQSAKNTEVSSSTAGQWATGSGMFNSGAFINADWEDSASLVGRHLAVHQHWQVSAISSTIPWYATWDDHDAGINDIEAKTPELTAMMARSARLFRLFYPNADLGATLAANVRTASSGPPDLYFAVERDDTLFVFCDTTTHANAAANVVLGASQLARAVADIKNSKTPLIVLVSGMQVLRVGDSRSVRKEAPAEFTSLMAAIKSVESRADVLILSGDIHRSQMLYSPEQFGINVMEYTSSAIATTSGQLLARCTSSVDEHDLSVGLLWSLAGRNFGTVDVRHASASEPLQITMRMFDYTNDAVASAVWTPRHSAPHMRMQSRVDVESCCSRFEALNNNSTGVGLPSSNAADACADAAGPTSSEAEAASRHNDRTVEETATLTPADVDAVLTDFDDGHTFFGRGLICDKKNTRLRALADAPEWSALVAQMAHQSSGSHLDAITRIDDKWVVAFLGGSLVALQRSASGDFEASFDVSVPFSDITGWPRHWGRVDAVAAYLHSDGSNRMHVFAADEYLLVREVTLPSGTAWLTSPGRTNSASTVSTTYPRSTSAYWEDSQDAYPAGLRDGLAIVATERNTSSVLEFYTADGTIYSRDSSELDYTTRPYSVCPGVAGVQRSYRVGVRSGWHARATTESFYLPPIVTLAPTPSPVAFSDLAPVTPLVPQTQDVLFDTTTKMSFVDQDTTANPPVVTTEGYAVLVSISLLLATLLLFTI